MKIKISIFLFSLFLMSLFVVGSIISISIKKSLSCIVFQFDDGKKRGFNIDKELDSSSCQCSVGGKITVVRSAQNFVSE